MKDDEFVAKLARAITGDSIAMQAVLQEYDPLFRSRSMIDGIFDEDCYQHILLRAIQETPKFAGIKKFFQMEEENE